MKYSLTNTLLKTERHNNITDFQSNGSFNPINELDIASMISVCLDSLEFDKNRVFSPEGSYKVTYRFKRFWLCQNQEAYWVFPLY